MLLLMFTSYVFLFDKQILAFMFFPQEFVAALRDVKEAVDDIYKEVSSMNEVCVDMKTRLQVTKSETRHLIHQTNSLQNQR